MPWFTSALSPEKFRNGTTIHKLAKRASVAVGTPSATSHSAQRLASSSAAISEQDHRFYPVYVHHVSKTALRYLQDARATWLVEQGLDRGLRLNANGTFVLQFPSRRGHDSGRIWTSYDASTREHRLSVYRKKLKGRFLLKDASSDTLHTIASLAQAEERVRHGVEQLIVALETTGREPPSPGVSSNF
jgi:hypothetical protein